MRISVNILTVLLSAGLVTSSFADTILTIGKRDTEEGHTFEIKDGRVLIVQKGAKAQAKSILYDRKARSMTVIDHAAKSYLMLEAEQLEELTEKVSDAIAEVDERLEAVNEEQQAAFRGLLRGVLSEVDAGAAKQAKKQLVKRPAKSKISTWECDVLDRKDEKGKRDATFYVVEPTALEVPEADMETLISMQTFIDDLLVSLPAGESIRAAAAPPEMFFPDGKFPVRTVTYKGGEKSNSDLKSIKVGEFDNAHHSVPEEYTKKQYPF